MPTTTKMGIAYPGSTDLVKDGATNMGTIATTVDAKTGLVLINTTSFSAVSSQSLNNVFSSTFTNYRLIVTGTVSVGESDALLQFRASGSTNTTNNYFFAVQSLGANGTTYNMTGTSQTSIKLGRFGGSSQGLIVVDIARPNVGVRVHVNTLNSCDGTTTFFQENASGLFVGGTAFDGFTLSTSAGTATGTVSVYGYNN